VIEKTDFSLYMKYLAYELRNKIHSEKDFKRHARFISENLKYPSKLFAVNYLINRDFRGSVAANE